MRPHLLTLAVSAARAAQLQLELRAGFEILQMTIVRRAIVFRRPEEVTVRQPEGSHLQTS